MVLRARQAGVRGFACAIVASAALLFAALGADAASAQSTTKIPSSIGKQGSGGFRVSTTGLPRGVSKTRFLRLASAVGRRWGLTYLGSTTLRARSGDRRNLVGYNSTVDRDALGVPITETTRRNGRWVVSERDILINPRVPWQQRGVYHT